MNLRSQTHDFPHRSQTERVLWANVIDLRKGPLFCSSACSCSAVRDEPECEDNNWRSEKQQANVVTQWRRTKAVKERSAWKSLWTCELTHQACVRVSCYSHHSTNRPQHIHNSTGNHNQERLVQAAFPLKEQAKLLPPSFPVSLREPWFCFSLLAIVLVI